MVSGAVARRPGKGGHTWVFLNWLLGLQRLGHEVLFVDQLEPGAAIDRHGYSCPIEASVNWTYLRDALDAHGLSGRYCLHQKGTGNWLGMPADDVVAYAHTSALLLNFMGYLDAPAVQEAAGRRVFVDIDPGFPQMWMALGLADPFAGHDAYVTLGLNVGRPGCAVPTCGLDWITTAPPVVLDCWQGTHGPVVAKAEPFTSVCSWRGPFDRVEYGNRSYGLRAHEWRQVMELPLVTGRRFEVALDIDAADRKDLARLGETGWLLLDPAEVAGDPQAYRAFLQASGAEFSAAKQMYVASHAGWFSDRSACYLAAGRPVIAQDTGWTEHFDPASGLLGYRTKEEAVARIREVCADPAAHAAAARAVAGAYFDSDVVIGRLLQALDLQ
jgi:hypothetical protein